MKRSSLVGLTVFFSFCLVIFSCRKEIEYYIHDREKVPSMLLESAKIWHLQHLDVDDAAPKLSAHWKDAWIIDREQKGTLVVVPAPEHYIANRDFSVRRFFVFNTSGSNVFDGRIVEFVGIGNYDINSNIDLLLKQHDSKIIPSFSGVILTYDINYQSNGSSTFENGQLSDVYSEIQNIEKGKDITKEAAERNIQMLGAIKGRNYASWMNPPCDPPGVSVVGVPGGLGDDCIVTFLVTYITNMGCTDYVIYNYMSHSCPSSGSAISGSGSGNESGSGGGGGGPGYGGGGGSVSATNHLALAPVEEIDIDERLDCFDAIDSGDETQYEVTVHVHSAVPSNPTAEFNFTNFDPGHAYITLKKSTSTQAHQLSFGFYPQNDTWVTPTKNGVSSGIGEEFSNGERMSDIRYKVSVDATHFGYAMSMARARSSKTYDLNDYNCTHYAIDIFNAALQNNNPLNVPNSNLGYKTPASLFGALDQLRQSGNNNVIKNSVRPPMSTNCD